MSDGELDDYKLHRRFDRFGRLVGDGAMKRVMDAHVMIVGLGGVGSFAAESVARSGVGRISVVDFDEVCITNFNRQLHALHGKVGTKKSAVMAERLQLVNPRAEIIEHPLFYSDETAEELIGRASRPDVVIDAIDHVTSKCHLLARCHRLGIPVVCATGSGGRLDPSAVKIADLAATTIDPLARSVRGILREKYDFPSSGDFGIPAVYSTERHTDPVELGYDNGKGFRCVCPQGDNPYFTCDSRNMIYGSSSFVTGTFGLFCASVAVRTILERTSV